MCVRWEDDDGGALETYKQSNGQLSEIRSDLKFFVEEEFACGDKHEWTQNK